jgi:hydroxyethylthiazole kinase
MNRELLPSICAALNAVRAKKPLIHHITNYVTVNDCANATLAIGASPIMADDIAEAADIASISSALVLNIGTLNAHTVESMLAAGKKANERGIPVVLDPVGAGASGLRSRTVKRLLSEIRFAVIRGNLSEIRFAAGAQTAAKGVDVSDADGAAGPEAGKAAAEQVARLYGCTAAVTGATDVVSDGRRTVLLSNGSPLLCGVTGTGCMCSSLIGSFCGATGDFFAAAAGGILTMSIAGEAAAESAGQKGSGSFRAALIDGISKMTPELLSERAKIHEA